MAFVPIKNASSRRCWRCIAPARVLLLNARRRAISWRGLLGGVWDCDPSGLQGADGDDAADCGAHEEWLAWGSAVSCSVDYLAIFRELDRQVKELDEQIQAWHREDAVSRRLQRIPGVGRSRRARLVASVSDAKTLRTAGNLPLGWG